MGLLQLIDICECEKDLVVRLCNSLDIKDCPYQLQYPNVRKLSLEPPSGKGSLTCSLFVNPCAWRLSQCASSIHGSTSTYVPWLSESVGRLSPLKLGFVISKMV